MWTVLLSLLACDSEPAEAPATPSAPVPPAAPAAPEAPAAKSATAQAPAPAAQAWEQLRASRAEATSFLKSNWNKYNENYHPSYVLDGNPKTAWVEGVSGNGEHETLTIPLSPLKSARAVKLRIRNGYQKSDNLFAANAVPKDVTITAWSSSQTTSKTVTLPHETGWQEVVVDLPDRFGLNAVSLRIDSVYPGSRYEDTCISDIEVFVDSEVPYNAAQEDARHKELMSWVNERVETAKFFAEKPTSYPFTATQLSSSTRDVTDADVVPAMTAPREAMAKMKAMAGWKKLSAARSLHAFPDGLYLSGSLLPLFIPDALSFADTPEATGHHQRQAETEDFEGEVVEMWSSETWRSNHKVTLTAAGTPSQIYFWEKNIEVGRGTYETRTDYLATYSDGVLQSIYLVQEGSSEVGPERQEVLYTFTRSGGPISAVEEKQIIDFGEQDWKEHHARVSHYTGS